MDSGKSLWQAQENQKVNGKSAEYRQILLGGRDWLIKINKLTILLIMN